MELSIKDIGTIIKNAAKVHFCMLTVASMKECGNMISNMARESGF